MESKVRVSDSFAAGVMVVSGGDWRSGSYFWRFFLGRDN